MSQIGSNPTTELSEDLIRHMVLTSILSYKRKFGDKYGQMVFCTDDRKYWRKEFFPYYKANRKKARDASKYDWNLIFNTLNKIRDEIADKFPYVVIRVEGAEADDIIATMCKYTQSNRLIQKYRRLPGRLEPRFCQRLWRSSKSASGTHHRNSR